MKNKITAYFVLSVIFVLHQNLLAHVQLNQLHFPAFQDSVSKKQIKKQGGQKASEKVYMITEGQQKIPWDQRSSDFKGPVELYDINGVKKEEGVWEYNHWVGAYKSYYSNGKLRQLFMYDAFGIKNGVQNYYHSNGQLSIEGIFKGGKENGVFNYYNEKGELTGTKTFLNGKVQSKKKK